MNKGLIDLKRASTPPANPLVDVEQSAPNNPSPLQAQNSANTNHEAAPPMAVVPEPSQPQSYSERVSTIGARIPESLHHNIKLFCTANRIEMQRFVQDALALHLQRLQDAPKE